MNEFLPRRPNHGQQKRKGTRAKHGSPLYTARIGCWATEEQYQFFHAKGGSIWLRQMLDDLMSPTSKESK